MFSYENKFSPENSDKPTLAFRFISVFSYIHKCIPENNRKLTINLQFTIYNLTTYGKLRLKHYWFLFFIYYFFFTYMFYNLWYLLNRYQEAIYSIRKTTKEKPKANTKPINIRSYSQRLTMSVTTGACSFNMLTAFLAGTDELSNSTL